MKLVYYCSVDLASGDILSEHSADAATYRCSNPELDYEGPLKPGCRMGASLFSAESARRIAKGERLPIEQLPQDVVRALTSDISERHEALLDKLEALVGDLYKERAPLVNAGEWKASSLIHDITQRLEAVLREAAKV